MAAAQLKLVQDAPPTFNPATRDPVRRIFEHWLYMFGRSPARCKLGPTRRGAILGALAMGYEPDDLMLAIEGMAADPLEMADRPDDEAARMREAVREIEWLLSREKRIERWMEQGEKLRAMAEQPDAPPLGPQQAPAVVEDPAATAAARRRLLAVAVHLRGPAHG